MDLTETVLKVLAKGPARVSAAAQPGRVLLERKDGGVLSVPAEVIAHLAESGKLRREDERIVRLEPVGAALDTPGRLVEARVVEIGGVQTTAMVNLSESPIGQLARRRDRNGVPFLDVREFNAGERLRSDYTRGQIMPRMGANWIASVSSGRRSAGGGVADLTDAALAARLRVEKAVEAVGPELSGVLIDVCCFLKGLERVESERGWPVRSAKVMLKTALAALARHYDPPARSSRAAPLHWGAADYKPTRV